MQRSSPAPLTDTKNANPIDFWASRPLEIMKPEWSRMRSRLIVPDSLAKWDEFALSEWELAGAAWEDFLIRTQRRTSWWKANSTSSATARRWSWGPGDVHASRRAGPDGLGTRSMPAWSRSTARTRRGGFRGLQVHGDLRHASSGSLTLTNKALHFPIGHAHVHFPESFPQAVAGRIRCRLGASARRLHPSETSATSDRPEPSAAPLEASGIYADAAKNTFESLTQAVTAATGLCRWSHRLRYPRMRRRAHRGVYTPLDSADVTADWKCLCRLPHVKDPYWVGQNAAMVAEAKRAGANSRSTKPAATRRSEQTRPVSNCVAAERTPSSSGPSAMKLSTPRSTKSWRKAFR